MVETPQPTESIAKKTMSLSHPNSEISAFPACQPNRVYKRILYLQKCAKNMIFGLFYKKKKEDGTTL
jgi:hypothetical protein